MPHLAMANQFAATNFTPVAAYGIYISKDNDHGCRVEALQKRHKLSWIGT